MSKVFTLWRFVIFIGLSKSFLWAVNTDTENRVFYFHIGLLERDGKKALSIIILPLSVIIGVASNE